MRLKRVVWWMALVVLVLSAAWIASYLYQAYTGGQTMARLSGEIAQAREASVPAAVLTVSQPEKPSAGESTAEKDGPAAAPVLTAYQALALNNPEMVGWVHIEGTMVDYPVMHTPNDPEKYLHHDFEGQYAFAGLPFLDAKCDPQAASANRIVYAHNMRSGQMFAQLTEYLDPVFRQAHPLISFDTLFQRGTYEVIAVLKVQAIGRQEPSMRCYRQTDMTSPEEVDALNEYLDDFADVREGIFQLGDDILTLSTCQRTSDTNRLVVMARKISGV